MYGVWNPNFAVKDDLNGTQSSDFDNDFFLADRLQLDFAFHATDEVSVYWRLRAPASQRWGTYDASSSIVSRYYYGQVKQDWGTLSAGRLKDSYTDLGLASLGYAPDGPDVNATAVLPFDWDTPASALHYVNRTDGGFQMAAGLFRLGTKRYYAQGPAQYDINGDFLGYGQGPYGYHDETNDLYVIEPAYFWDGGAFSFGIHYLRDHVQSHPAMPAYKEYALNPAFMQSFGDITVHFEAKAGFGKAADEVDWNKENKSSGYAAYLDADFNYGPGNVALAGWYAAGPGEKGEDKAKGTVGLGDAFAPLIVAYGANGNRWWRNVFDDIDTPVNATAVALANANAASDMMSSPDQQLNGNHWAAALMGSHAISDDLTFTYAVAYLNLLKVDPGYKKNIGYEADLGLQIQLLDNLHLGTTLGYMIAGDALKEGGTDGKKPDDAYSWFTTLTFSF